MKEVETLGSEADKDEISASEQQVDVSLLLAAHEKRRLATYQSESAFSSTSSSSSSSPSRSSESSLSSPDDDELECEGLLGVGSATCVTDTEGSLLRVNPNLPPDKASSLADVYTRQYLFTLPALFLAVARGNSSLVYLLLKYGANVNFQVRLLYMCLCM